MKIVIFGNGNVATHLGKAFFAAGHRIVQVFGRNRSCAQELATALEAEGIGDLAELDPTADLYLLAVSDGAIAPLAERLPKISGTVVHCSGATELSVLGGFPSHGVLYPIQSVTKSADLDISAVPFATEGNTAQTTDLLLELAQRLSAKSFVCNSPQRLALHVAAVFANNFANAMFQIAHEILQENGLSFDLLKPIVLETAQKVQTHAPKDAQTGPAKRSDTKTIQKHLDFIGKNADRAKTYRLMTKLISVHSN